MSYHPSFQQEDLQVNSPAGDLMDKKIMAFCIHEAKLTSYRRMVDKETHHQVRISQCPLEPS